MTKPVSQQCTATSTTTGRQCQRRATTGATVCRAHGAGSPKVKAMAAVRATINREAMNWGLDAPDVDPGTFLLALVAQAHMRVKLYAQQLEEFITEKEKQGIPVRTALIGEIWSNTTEGVPEKVGEALRGFVQAEASERDRAATLCKTAIAAGLAERQVRLAEAHGALIADVFRRVMRDPLLGLSLEQRRLVPQLAERYLGELAA
jgi:hypothetical protein